MKTRISHAYIRLNEKSKLKTYLLIENDNGVLLVDDGLFSISFNNRDEIKKQGINIISEHFVHLSYL